MPPLRRKESETYFPTLCLCGGFVKGNSVNQTGFVEIPEYIAVSQALPHPSGITISEVVST